jgi:hypothetical protein
LVERKSGGKHPSRKFSHSETIHGSENAIKEKKSSNPNFKEEKEEIYNLFKLVFKITRQEEMRLKPCVA